MKAKSAKDTLRSGNLDDRETNTVVSHLSNRERLHLIWKYSLTLDWTNEAERNEICQIWGQNGMCRTPGLDPSSDLWRVLFGDPFDEHKVARAGGWDRILRLLVGAEEAVGSVASVPFPRLGGSYVLKSESMPAAAREYQATVTNVTKGYVYRYGGRAFDSEGLGRAAENLGRQVLVDAKHLEAGSKLVDPATGAFKPFMRNTTGNQILGQVIAADGVPIEYWVASERAAIAWRQAVNAVEAGAYVRVIVVP